MIGALTTNGTQLRISIFTLIQYIDGKSMMTSWSGLASYRAITQIKIVDWDKRKCYLEVSPREPTTITGTLAKKLIYVRQAGPPCLESTWAFLKCEKIRRRAFLDGEKCITFTSALPNTHTNPSTKPNLIEKQQDHIKLFLFCTYGWGVDENIEPCKISTVFTLDGVVI